MCATRGRRLLERLAGGDRRSIGRVAEIVDEVLREPPLFQALFDGLHHADPLVRMRAADAVEKITAERPDWLQPHKEALLRVAAASDQQEVRWHVAQMLPRLALTPAERVACVGLLKGYLKDRSSIVRTFALQGLADLAERDRLLRGEVVAIVRNALRSGSPAMKSRGRRLLRQLGVAEPSPKGGSRDRRQD